MILLASEISAGDTFLALVLGVVGLFAIFLLFIGYIAAMSWVAKMFGYDPDNLDAGILFVIPGALLLVALIVGMFIMKRAGMI